MSINLEDAKHVADLARLELSEKELTVYTEQLNQILAYAQELDKLDTTAVEPTYNSLASGTPLRTDAVQAFNHPAGLLENAPEVSANSFVVPRIL